MSKFTLAVVLTFISLKVMSQDLIITDYKGPATFDQYHAFSEMFTLKNDGIVNIQNAWVYCHAYLSNDPVLDSSDDQIGASDLVENLAAGQSVDVTFDRGEVNVAPGVYFLIVEIDFYNSVSETDEENNTKSITQITVNQPNVDWAITSLVPYESSPALHLSEQLSFSIQIENSGSTPAGGRINADFFLSSDQSLTGDDITIGTYQRWTDGKPVISEFTGFIIPPSISPGQYYLIGKVDSPDDFTETNENNNQITSEVITIEDSNIDLSIESLIHAEADDYSVVANFTINNGGSTPAGGYSVSVYLSDDNVLDPGTDYSTMVVDNVSLPYVLPLQSQYASVWGTYHNLPGPIPGSYYVILVVNETQSVHETNYSNNIFVSDFPVVTIAAPFFPKVSIVNGAFEESYDDTDMHLSLKMDFENSGDIADREIPYDLQILTRMEIRSIREASP
jgi:hypothetical protein